MQFRRYIKRTPCERVGKIPLVIKENKLSMHKCTLLGLSVYIIVILLARNKIGSAYQTQLVEQPESYFISKISDSNVIR